MINTLFISGDLERLSRFWMSGMCKPNIQEKHASEPLSIAQFLSAFLLLGIGTVMSLIFIVMEHLYMRYMQNYVDRKNAEVGGCFSLVSQVLIYRMSTTDLINSKFTNNLLQVFAFAIF